MSSSSASARSGARERECHKYVPGYEIRLAIITALALIVRYTCRYYEPFQRIMSRAADSSESQPHAASDKALTALAQLGALRLNCRRAVISLFDRRHQYILAEATRSFCLHSSVPQDPDDALWLGSCTLTRPATVCEYTLRSTAKEQDLDDVVQISELGEFQNYSHTPSNLRFYAGAPIWSPDGYAIGAYSIFDDSERHDLTEQEMFFLRDMAKTVMLHMDLVRGHEEHVRDGHMVLGLGNFVEGKAGLEDWFCGYVEEDDGDVEKRDSDEVAGCPERSDDEDPCPDEEGSSVAQASHMDQDPLNEHPQPVSLSSSHYESRSSCPSQATNNVKSQIASTDVKTTFSRAANIILDAIDVDGTAFFDASISSFAGLVENAAYTHDSDSEHSANSSSPGDLDRTGPQDDENRKETESDQCPILAYATPDKPSLGSKQEMMNQFCLAENFLHQLLKRHPRGKVFNFDPEDQTLGSANQGTSDIAEDFGQQLHPPEKALQDPCKRSSRRIRRQNELRALRKVFPGVRSLIFVPLWDNHRQRWFAAGFAWTNSATRLLHLDSELSFLAAFGHSIMAEVARLDTVMADKAKADLLSSISHELRSPLHGVLGSIECLEETSLNASQLSLVDAIDTCGRTLLGKLGSALIGCSVSLSVVGVAVQAY